MPLLAKLFTTPLTTLKPHTALLAFSNFQIISLTHQMVALSNAIGEKVKAVAKEYGGKCE
jgi:hypothetical protein